jgi:hypothetical protein
VGNGRRGKAEVGTLKEEKGKREERRESTGKESTGRLFLRVEGRWERMR